MSAIRNDIAPASHLSILAPGNDGVPIQCRARHVLDITADADIAIYRGPVSKRDLIANLDPGQSYRYSSPTDDESLTITGGAFQVSVTPELVATGQQAHVLSYVLMPEGGDAVSITGVFFDANGQPIVDSTGSATHTFALDADISNLGLLWSQRSGASGYDPLPIAAASWRGTVSGGNVRVMPGSRSMLNASTDIIAYDPTNSPIVLRPGAFCLPLEPHGVAASVASSGGAIFDGTQVALYQSTGSNQAVLISYLGEDRRPLTASLSATLPNNAAKGLDALSEVPVGTKFVVVTGPAGQNVFGNYAGVPVEVDADGISPSHPAPNTHSREIALINGQTLVLGGW